MRWLQYEVGQSVAQQSDEGDSLALRLLLENDTEEQDVPEQPQILAILREQRRLDVKYYDAPLPKLPYIFRMELNTAIDAEIEFKEIQLTNARILDRFKNDENLQSE